MGLDTDLRQAVFTRIKNASILDRIAWPNRDKVIVKPYLRVNILSFETNAVGIKSLDLHQGIIQVDAVVKSGVGENIPIGYCEQIIALFPRNLHLKENTTLIRFNKKAYLGPPLQETDGNGYFIPVSIPYLILS